MVQTESDRKEIYHRYYLKHKEQKAQYQKNYRREQLPQIRAELIAALGWECVECGFDNPLALEVDHVNGHGCEDRRKKGRNGLIYYRKVLDEVRAGSKDYQLLCCNHNHIKEMKRRLTISLQSLSLNNQ
jgi:Uri superfamily endonuclease